MILRRCQVDVSDTVIAASSGGSYCASHDGQAVRALDYDPSFPLSLAEKDLACMKKLAVETGVATPMMDKASELYRRTTQKYGGDDPWLTVVRHAFADAPSGEPLELEPEPMPGIDFGSLFEAAFPGVR